MSVSLISTFKGVDGENIYLFLYLTIYHTTVKSRLRCLVCDIRVTKTPMDLSVFLLTHSACGYTTLF